MPRLIIAGLGKGIIERVKAFEPDIKPWDVRFIPSEVPKSDLNSCWPAVLIAANELQHEGAHILAFHNNIDQREQFEREIVAQHRLVWVDKDVATGWGSAESDKRLHELAAFELEWRALIRPRGVSSPLMLPESAFKAKRAVSPMWAKAQRVQIDRDTLETVAILVNRFRQSHRQADQKNAWKDTGGRLFAGPRPEHWHGDYPSNRRRKFTFLIPQGFHYDVTKARGGTFAITDQAGRRQPAGQHINVDCHGHLRRGK